MGGRKKHRVKGSDTRGWRKSLITVIFYSLCLAISSFVLTLFLLIFVNQRLFLKI